MTGKNWLLFFARNTHFVDFMTVVLAQESEDWAIFLLQVTPVVAN